MFTFETQKKIIFKLGLWKETFFILIFITPYNTFTIQSVKNQINQELSNL